MPGSLALATDPRGAAIDARPAAAWRWQGGLALAALLLAWLAGTAVQLQSATLWPASLAAGGAGVALLVLGLALVGVARRRMTPAVAWALGLLAVAVLAWGLTEWRATERLARRLPAGLEGVDLVLVGQVNGLPQLGPDGPRFLLSVATAYRAVAGVPQPVPVALQGEVWLGWSPDWQGDATLAGAPPAVRSGERWQLPVRLRQPHGQLNPQGFDAELLWFEQDVVAVGQVRGNAVTAARRLEGAPSLSPLTWLAAARQRARDQILLRLGDRPEVAGLIAALVVGDQSAIDAAGWELYRRTGIAHLVSISGMHITLFAWLAAGLVQALWRRRAGWCHRCPAPVAGRWGGLGLAAVYAVLAGWGVPAQRTVWMLATTVALRSLGVAWPASLVLLTAAVVVSLADPWALLQPGFWLSFTAVWLLMASEPQAAAPPGKEDGEAKPATQGVPAPWRRWAHQAWAWWRGDLRAQGVATVGLAPLSLLLFQQLSLVGLLANLVAVPVVTFVITPLALVGALWAPAWDLAGAAAAPLLAGLQAMAAWPGAVWALPVAPLAAQALALLGGVVLMLPVPLPLRLLGPVLCLPLLWPAVPMPAPGQFRLLAADVGQGSAVLVQTAGHTLLHDTGPQVGRDSDAGRRVLQPLLQALGVSRLDGLVLSHGDLDHVGGAASLLQALPVQALHSSLVPGHALRELARRRGAEDHTCGAGQQWDWDGVYFEFLHPPAGAALTGVKPNTLSCVLRVRDAAGRVALITGDLEAEQEAALAAAHGAGLVAELLLVPHHGSKTSSSEAFLDLVRPQIAVIQNGYRNRYGHPHPGVVDRYRARGITLVRSDHCGAWRWAEDGATCTRDVRRRYWHWSPPPAPPAAGAVVATDKPAGDRE